MTTAFVVPATCVGGVLDATITGAVVVASGASCAVVSVGDAVTPEFRKKRPDMSASKRTNFRLCFISYGLIG